MIKDFLRFSISNLRQRKTRSYLTMIGIFIGIAAVVSLISLGQGLQNAIDYQFQKIGSNRIIVTPGGAIAGPASGELTAEKLYEHDVDVIKNVRGVDFATGSIMSTLRIKFREKTKYATILGFDTDSRTTSYIEAIGLFDIETGRNFRPGEKYKAVAGYKIAKDSFERELRTGDNIEVEGLKLELTGIQKNIGTGFHDAIIRIPKDTLKEILGKDNEEVNSVFVVVSKGFNTEEVAEDIKKAMRKDHDVKEGKEDFSVETARNVVQGFSNILLVVQAVLIGIAGISLLVGGIGIMNTMYTAVLERTKEIGIMKAVGAKNSDIMSIFLIESGLLGILGGIIGIAIGMGIGEAIEYIAVLKLGVGIFRVEFSPALALGALTFSFIVGAVSGMMPARKAAGLKPVDALRYE